MPVTHHVDPKSGILHVVRSGEVSAEEDVASFHARLEDPLVVPGIAALIDSTGIMPADSTARVREMAERVVRNAHRLRFGPVAIVVGSDVQYGMTRMFMTLVEHVYPHTEVFRDRDQALAWLAQMRGATPPAT